MKRYYFNIRAGDEYLADEHGENCPSVHAAGAKALAGAQELLKELQAFRRAPHRTAFEITDQRGRLCLRIPFTLAQTMPPPTAGGCMH